MISAQLNPISSIIVTHLNKVKPYGWISQFLNESIIDRYGKNFELQVNKDILVEITDKRNKLEEEIKKVAAKVKSLRK